MKKTFIVNESFNDMRLDRWIKNNIIKLPQSLIEKKIRIGSVKINDKKVKSSTKVKTNDIVSLFNFKFLITSKK